MGIVHTVVTVAEPRRGTEGARSKSHEDAVSPCQRSIAKMRLSVWPGGWRRARGRSPSPAWPPGRAGSKSRKTSMLPDRFAGGGDAGPLPSTLSISELSSGPYASPPGPCRGPGLVPGPVWPKKKTGVALSHFHAVAAPGNA